MKQSVLIISARESLSYSLVHLDLAKDIKVIFQEILVNENWNNNY